MSDEESINDVLLTIDNILQYGEDQDVKEPRDIDHDNDDDDGKDRDNSRDEQDDDDGDEWTASEQIFLEKDAQTPELIFFFYFWHFIKHQLVSKIVICKW